MNVIICNKQSDLPLKNQQRKIRCLVQFVLDREKKACDEIGIFFISDRAMKKMHKDFFQDDSPTDCITHPVDDGADFGPIYLGDVFVCPKTAIHYSAKKNIDLYKEITLYILHGLLHLIGYDDIDPLERKKMKKAEKKYMNLLEKQGCILQ